MITLKCTHCGKDFQAAHNRKVPICGPCAGNLRKQGKGSRQTEKAKANQLSKHELEPICVDDDPMNMNWRKTARIFAPGDWHWMDREFKVPTEIFEVPITECRDCGACFELAYGIRSYKLRCTKCEKTVNVQTIQLPSFLGNRFMPKRGKLIDRLIPEENKPEPIKAKSISVEEFFRVIERSAGKCKCGGEYTFNSPYNCPKCNSTNLKETDGNHYIAYRLRENATMSKKRHNERCPKCKQSVKDMLSSVFSSRVVTNWDTRLPCRLEDYMNTDIADVLGPIYEALQKHRSHSDFVRSYKLSRADYYVADLGLIIEFDEGQHFTKPRDIALSFYRPNFTVGFSVEKWRRLCKETDAHDDNPPDRDEQRAWYDTLKDLAPGMGKTYRLYARDVIWCDLNPDDRSDLIYFKHVVLDGKFER